MIRSAPSRGARKRQGDSMTRGGRSDSTDDAHGPAPKGDTAASAPSPSPPSATLPAPLAALPLGALAKRTAVVLAVVVLFAAGLWFVLAGPADHPVAGHRGGARHGARAAGRLADPPPRQARTGHHPGLPRRRRRPRRGGRAAGRAARQSGAPAHQRPARLRPRPHQAGQPVRQRRDPLPRRREAQGVRPQGAHADRRRRHAGPPRAAHDLHRDRRDRLDPDHDRAAADRGAADLGLDPLARGGRAPAGGPRPGRSTCSPRWAATCAATCSSA